MSDNSEKTRKVTLDMELSDFLGLVSKMGGASGEAPISDISQKHAMEAEDIRKAWFKHVLLNMEKLADAIENLRSRDLDNLKKDLERDINRIEERVVKGEEKLEEYKIKIIQPLNDQLVTITVKIGMWGMLAGFVGSGVLAVIVYIFKIIISHTTGAIPPPGPPNP